MAISAADYRAKFLKTKTLTFADGIEFVIRKISPVDLWESKIKLGSEDAIGDSIKLILSKGILEPKIGDGPDDIKINDLEIDHINKLIDEIMTFSGYKTEDGKPTDFLSRPEKGLISTQ